MLDKQKTITLLLRIAGTIEILAFISVFMPRSWMVAGHTFLGLGEFPDGPLIDFMIRQSSYVYGIQGVLMWILSFDPKRFLPIIMYIGISFTIAGPIFLWINTTSALPFYITLMDSGSVFCFGIILLWLSISIQNGTPS